MADSMQAQSRTEKSAIGSQSKKYYIADIPLITRDKLCHHLDAMSIWMELADMMQLYSHDINAIRRRVALGESPTDHLLRSWGNVYNHTVTELFMLLNEKKLYSAMSMLRDFVPHDLHEYISDSDQNSQHNQYTAIPSERIVNQYAISNLEIDYKELAVATNNWNADNFLGQGGFGTVYKGDWKRTEWAIKKIHYCASNGCADAKVQIQQGLNELKYSNSFRHDNVLPLCGYSTRGETLCLVYQYMRGGSLNYRLYTKEKPPLSLSERVKISLGTARGINYLHTHTPDKPLIHGDIKPDNILLNEFLVPKIGDFGLAREGPNATKKIVEVTQIFGTRYYLPNEFLNLKKLSTLVDTYSFGVTLLETFTGQRAFVKNRQLPLLTEYVASFPRDPKKNPFDLLDPNLELKNTEEFKRGFEILALGLYCTDTNPYKRPEMESVLIALSRYGC